MWKELTQEFQEVFDHYTNQTLWITTREGEMRRSLTQEEEMQRKKTGIPHEQITQGRLWNKKPHGIALNMSTKTKVRVICLLEYKRMSDVTNHYIFRFL